MRLFQTLTRSVATLALVTIAACGGGGGGGGDPTPPAPAQAPVITSQPAAATVPAGQAATFSVSAAGSAPLAYQWRRGGAAIAGATAASYTTAATTLADDGASFDVVVSNAAGSATSAAAVLTVTAPPPVAVFTQQPAGATVAAGAGVSFGVAATCGGSAVTAFQWQRSSDGGTTFADIAGATTAALAFTAALSDDGARLRATTACGGQIATSDSATLAVTAPVAAAPTVCTGTGARGWCWAHPVPQGNALFGLLVDGSTQVTAVGGAGTLLRSTDGGLGWGGVSPLPDLGTNVRDLVGIARVDANRLIAVGHQVLLTSADNGARWSAVTAPAGLVLKDLQFTAVTARGGRALTTGVLAGGQGVLLASDNGGLSWTQVASPSRALWDVAFVTDTLALAVGDLTRVLRSTDGGVTWTEQRISTMASGALRKLRALDATTVLVAGDNVDGGLYRSVNGGLDWVPVASAFINGFRGLDVRHATGAALAVGANGAIFRSTDRGQAWTRIVDLQGGYTLWDVRFLSDTVALAVGDHGTVLRSTDAGLTWQPVGRSSRAANGNDAFAFDVHFGGAQVGLLAGQSGMLRSADGGRSWNTLPDFDGKRLLSVAFADASTAVALQQTEPANASEDFDLVRSTDGGLTFTPVGRFPARFVRFNGTGIGVAVGRYGAVWRSTDRGRTWTQVRPTSLAEVTLDQVRWADDTTVLAISARGLLRSTDAGLTWAAASVPPGVVFNAVAFRTGLQGLGVGYDNANATYLLRTADGGATWSATRWNTLVGNAAVYPFALAFADAQTVVVVGGSRANDPDTMAATLLRSADGGSTWTREPSNLRGDLNAVHFANPTDGVAVGSGFGVLHTTTGGAR